MSFDNFNIKHNMIISVIAAFTNNGKGIGKNGVLPWKLKKDMSYFKAMTIPHNKLFQNAVIMGRKTWDSIPEQFRPLKDRVNIVITRNKNLLGIKETECEEDIVNNVIYEKDGVYFTNSLFGAYEFSKEKNIHECFVIGGEQIYKQAFEMMNESYKVNKIYTTTIYKKFECDTFFPPTDFETDYKLCHVYPIEEENDIYFRFLTYYSKKYMKKHDVSCIFENTEENEALKSMEQIMRFGQERIERTGVGTRSLFGLSWKYDISSNFPLMTTKRMFFRGIFEELALYISGKTDNKILQEKNIHIWDGNTSREFLDKRGLTNYPEGDMGETYGFNMRHYGANYIDCHHDYSGQGFDQLQYVINSIKNDPSSRRMLINLWNPATCHKAALPSCMMQYQFYVRTDLKKLDLQVYLRSSDYFLANNWNVCTAALLVYMICNLEDIDLTPGEITVVTGDTHIYNNHLDAVKENLKRTPRPFPQLFIKEKKKSLEDFTYEDIKLVGYTPYPSIKAEMAV